MNKWQLYKLITKNDELKDRRHPMFEKNRFMKFFAWFMFIYYAGILVLMGVTMPMGLRGIYPGVAAFHVLDGFVAWLLIVDFWGRFLVQEIPAQTVKPYSLLPISRKFLTSVFLTRYGFSMGNLFWWLMLAPFGALSVLPLLGWGSYVGWLAGWWLLCVINGFLYFALRALTQRHLGWYLLPVAIHTALVLLMVLPDKSLLDAPFTHLLYQCALGNPLVFLSLGAGVGLCFWVNYRLQSQANYNEVARKEDIKHASRMTFFERYGAMGEYLKLEMKLRLRNRQVRIGFFMLLALSVLFVGILYFSSIYDATFMKSFIILYIYIGLPTLTLTTIMSYEGNYIDGLMSRRESIYQLLCAKFYFNVATMLVPIVLTIPLMIIGKVSLWMNVGYFFFTIGVIFPALFQMVVYNGNTIPLDQKVMGKKGNMVQQIVTMVIMFLPLGIEALLVLALGHVWGYVAMSAMGIGGLVSHRWWLRNVYTRFMLRRHKNMENFRASRGS